MTNNNEDTKRKIEECISYLKETNYSKSLEYLKELTPICYNYNVTLSNLVKTFPEKTNELLRQLTTMKISQNSIEELFYKGMGHLYSGINKPKGIKFFKEILKIGTNDANVLFNIAQILKYDRIYSDYAIIFFEKIIDIETDNVDLLFNTGRYLFELGNKSTGLKCFDKTLELTNDITKLYKMTEILQNSVYIAVKNEYYNKILELPDTKDFNDTFCKGIAAYYLCLDDKATDYFKQVSKSNDNNILYHTANKLIQLNKIGDAKRILYRLIESCRDIAILCSVAKILSSLKDDKAKIAIYNVYSFPKDKINIISIFDLANFLYSNKNLKDAKRLYKKVFEVDKYTYTTYDKLIKDICAVILEKKDYVLFFPELQQDEINDKYIINLLYDLGIVLLRNKDDRAFECFKKIVQFNNKDYENDIEILFIKGVASKILNKKDNAIYYFEKILDTKEASIHILFDVGLQLFGLKNDTAQKCFKKVSDNFPPQSNDSRQNNILLYKKGMSEFYLHKNEAIESLKKIKTKTIEDTQILRQIGIIMYQYNEFTYATDCFKKIISIEPSSELDYFNIGLSYKYLLAQKNKKIEKYLRYKDKNIAIKYCNILIESKTNEVNEYKKIAEQNYWTAVKKHPQLTFQYNYISPFLVDFIDKINDNKSNELYHYTSVGGLKGILENQEFWVTKSDYLNDHSETKYIDDVLKILNLKGISLLDKKYINDYKNCKKKGKKDVYILSMTTEKDSLPMWNYYGGDGYNLEVNKENFQNNFLNSYPYICSKVIYINKEENKDDKDSIENKEKMEELFSNIYYSGMNFQKQDKALTDKIIKEVILCHVRILSLFVKHPGFSYENEYRYAFIPQFWLPNISTSTERTNENNNYNYNSIINYNCNIKTNGKEMIPFIKLPIYGLIGSDKSIISKIRFSPTLDKDIAQKGIDDFLKTNCNYKIKVKPSEIPVRKI